jgi:hypothetical protein
VYTKGTLLSSPQNCSNNFNQGHVACEDPFQVIYSVDVMSVTPDHPTPLSIRRYAEGEWADQQILYFKQIPQT